MIASKQLIKGWMVRKAGSQDQHDKYSKLFDELESSDKSALFELLPGIKLYLFPLTPTSRNFAAEIGVRPLAFDSIDHETHVFIWICNVKQTMAT